MYTYQENTSDKKDILWYSMREHCMTIFYHAVSTVFENNSNGLFISAVINKNLSLFVCASSFSLEPSKIIYENFSSNSSIPCLKNLDLDGVWKVTCQCRRTS